MPAGRHRKTTPAQAWLRRLGAVTVPAVAVGAVLPVATALQADGDSRSAGHVRDAARATLPERVSGPARASRSLGRDAPPPRPAEVDGLSEIAIANDPSLLTPRWSTARLELRVDPAKSADEAGVLKAGVKVLATDEVRNGWVAVVQDDQLVWARKDDLARTRQAAESAAVKAVAAAAGVSLAPCPDGSGVESGLVPNAVKVYRAVCAAFPAVSSWGGWSSHGEHVSGKALDIMSSGSFGQSIAEWVRAHAAKLGVAEVIYAQRIWTVERAGEGWRPMSDRGSATANHYDHVHVSVF